MTVLPATVAAWLCLLAGYPAVAATVNWIGGSKGQTNWSDAVNWSGGAPADNDVVFTNEGIAAPGIINNVVNHNLTVRSLSYRNLVGGHTTLILPGVTLTVAGGTGLTAGAVGNPDTLAAETNTITGPGGTLVLSNQVVISQGSDQSDAHNVVLDMSGLDTFIMDGGRSRSRLNYLNVGQNRGYNSTGDRWPCGTLYLARTNHLSVAPKIAIQNHKRNAPALPPVTPSALYLGETNAIFVNEIDVGYADSTNALLAFNPAFIPATRTGRAPVAYFRAQIGDNQPRVRLWVIADNDGNAKVPITGASDFNGGHVNILVDFLRIGRGSSRTNCGGTGTLSFDSGIIDANTIRAGEQTVIGGGAGVGILNVNSNATLGTSATLVVNSNLILAQIVGPPASGTAGILNVNGGTVHAHTITSGGGAARIMVNHGTLNVTNTALTSTNPIRSLALTNATLRFAISTNPAPVVVVTSLVTGGTTNRIDIASLPAIKGYPVTFPVIHYERQRGAFNIGCGVLPPGKPAYVGKVINDVANGSVSLVLTNGPAPWWARRWIRVLAVASLFGLAVAGYYLRIKSIKKKNLELEVLVRQRTSLLSERTAQLEAANAELEAFSYSVSHDLRAPLRSIDGFSQVLLQDYSRQLDVEGQDNLQRVRCASQRMARLIDDLLALSKMTRDELHRRTVDLTALAWSIAGELQAGEPQRKVEFVIAPGLAANADPNLIRIVLENLLGNAWKFTNRKPAAKIELGALQEGDQRVYFVRDNGAGFDAEHATKLFGAFQRLHTTTEFEGTGIGLATVRRIIHRHGGRVWAKGAIDQGATFYFTLSDETARTGEPQDQQHHFAG